MVELLFWRGGGFIANENPFAEGLDHRSRLVARTR
jgi:hypothetical protein